MAVLLLAYFRHRQRRRERGLSRLLDRADALEALLQQTRARMQEMRQVVGRVPSDIAGQASASLDSETLVQQGLRDVLEHRLWIARNGLTVPQRKIDDAYIALDRAYARIAAQLDQLEIAGAELADATQAALEQAAREPDTLTRQPAND